LLLRWWHELLRWWHELLRWWHRRPACRQEYLSDQQLWLRWWHRRPACRQEYLSDQQIGLRWWHRRPACRQEYLSDQQLGLRWWHVVTLVARVAKRRQVLLQNIAAGQTTLFPKFTKGSTKNTRGRT